MPALKTCSNILELTVMDFCGHTQRVIDTVLNMCSTAQQCYHLQLALPTCMTEWLDWVPGSSWTVGPWVQNMHIALDYALPVALRCSGVQSV